MKATVLFLLSITMAMLLQGGEPRGSCSAPEVFPNASVNIIILPYIGEEDRGSSLDTTSSQLTLLLQQTTLFSSLKYKSVATLRLVPTGDLSDQECQAEIVARKILGEQSGARRELRPGGAAILLWGQLYREGDQVYLCSYARVVKRSANLAMQSFAGNAAFSARLPAETVSFPPRSVTRNLLEEIQEAYRKSASVHKDRSLTSPGMEIPLESGKPLAYQVLEATPDGWMRVSGGYLKGWINANEILRSAPLTNILPELRFVDGAIGYLETEDTRNAAAFRATASSSLKGFIEAAGEGSTLAVATAKSMLAVMYSTDRRTQAQGHQLAREAVALVPYNADARNLELVYRLKVSGQEVFEQGKWEPVAREFAQAAALGLGNQHILKNLDNFYVAVLATPGLVNDAGANDIQMRRSKVATLREAANRTPQR